MGLQEFIIKLGCLGFDIAALHTGYDNGQRHCDLTIVQRDDTGVFFSQKCQIHRIDEMLEKTINEVRDWQQEATK